MDLLGVVADFGGEGRRAGGLGPGELRLRRRRRLVALGRRRRIVQIDVREAGLAGVGPAPALEFEAVGRRRAALFARAPERDVGGRELQRLREEVEGAEREERHGAADEEAREDFQGRGRVDGGVRVARLPAPAVGVVLVLDLRGRRELLVARRRRSGRRYRRR